MTQLTAALPSALAGIGTALVVYALGRRLFGARAGRLAALVTVTTQGVFLHARLPLPDMLMTLFIALGLWMLWELGRGRSGPWWLGFYGSVAAAFWSKGPAGFLPLAVALAWFVARGGAGEWRRLRPGRGVLLLVALVAPWWLAGFASDAAAMRRVLVLDHLLWYLPPRPALSSVSTPVQHVFGILFPWVIALPAALYQAARSLREEPGRRDAISFVLASAAVTLGFVAVSQTQRFRYYLPLVPPASLLIGWWWAGAAARGTRQVQVRLYVASAAGLAVVLLAALAARDRWPATADLPGSPVQILALGAALAVMVGGFALGMRHNRLARAFPAAWAASSVLLIAGYH